uniref:Uncharacterized protein n=1 Tax=Oncorhynchus mykiss TaxID=8022 RepID=A0A8C7WAG4_ONCMY
CRNVDHFSGDFVAEPMGDKLLLKDTGGARITAAFVVLGQFLLLRKDGELFTEWLKVTSGANTRNAASCSQCLNECCDAFLRDWGYAAPQCHVEDQFCFIVKIQCLAKVFGDLLPHFILQT